MNETADLAGLETRLGHHFTDRALLSEALTHSSALDGRKPRKSLERLEFLGDRVLGLAIAEALYSRHRAMKESELAPQLSALVRKSACATAARAMGLGPFLFLGKTEEKGGGRDKDSILADACEAVIAAVFLDAGWAAARDFVERFWAQALAERPREARDPKTILQEWAEAQGAGAPSYRLLHRAGPDHAPRFQIEAAVGGRWSGQGEGPSKQAAERAAARALLAQTGILLDA